MTRRLCRGTGASVASLLRLQEHFEHAALLGAFHRGDTVGEWVAFGDKAGRVHVAAFEEPQCRRERTAARADDGDLVDDEGREVERDLARIRRLEHQRAARTQSAASESEAAPIRIGLCRRMPRRRRRTSGE